MKKRLGTMRNLLGALGLVLASNLYAETTATTATDRGGDVAIVGQMIQQEAEATADSSLNAQPSVPKVAVTGEETAAELPNLDVPIIDLVGLLPSQEKAQLENKLWQLHKEAKAQIGIVIVPTTGQQDIFNYSLNIAEDWKLGSEKYDNGLLIVVAKNDRRIQILTGYGLEGVLPDIVVNRIIRDQITPYFKLDQYGQGLIQGVNEIEKILNLDPEVAAQAAQALYEQEELAYQEAKVREHSLARAFIILLIAIFISGFIGKRLAGVGAGIAGIVCGLITGSSLLLSLLIGLVLFVLIISGIAQNAIHVFPSIGGGRREGDGFGGGFGGGGGGFGGGGASGSW